MIKTVGIVGMGAMGLMYGEHLQSSGEAEVCYVMDETRLKKNQQARFTVNGKMVKFKLLTPKQSRPLDLVIFATKFSGLETAMEEMSGFIGENTIIYSVLNGITSEEKLEKSFGRRNLLHCVVLGMDAVREGTALTFVNKGIVKIGTVYPENTQALDAVCELFERAKLPYSKEDDIMHALWAKLMLNVGINQTCMIYETSYGGVFDNAEARENMYAAMHEVIAVAKAEDVSLGEEDFQASIKILRGLDYKGMPSMRQDGVARRKTEVELFAGAVVALGKKHNIPVPVNAMYYEKVKEMEAEW